MSWHTDIERAIERVRNRSGYDKISVPGTPLPKEFYSLKHYRCTACGRRYMMDYGFTYLEPDKKPWEQTAWSWPQGCPDHGLAESETLEVTSTDDVRA